jgi:hypothetical protein
VARRNRISLTALATKSVVSHMHTGVMQRHRYSRDLKKGTYLYAQSPLRLRTPRRVPEPMIWPAKLAPSGQYADGSGVRCLQNAPMTQQRLT